MNAVQRRESWRCVARNRRRLRRFDRGAVAKLRRRYFAAADLAGRHGVVFDDLLIHLWRSRQFGGRLRLRSVVHLEDLALAVACLQRQSRGWADLIDQNEGHLVRACRRHLGDSDAIVFVRRLLSELRLNARTEVRDAVLTLRAYRGTRPLTAWLGERAVARLAATRHWQRPRLRGIGPVADRESPPQAMLVGPDSLVSPRGGSSARLALVLQRVLERPHEALDETSAFNLGIEPSRGATCGPISLNARA